MIETTIKEVSAGTLFTLKPIEEPNENQVYVRDSYNRSTKKYEAYKYADINCFREFRGDKKIYLDFIF